MASQQDSDYELLTEHLGYPPVALLDDIINTVNVLADRALDSVEQLLLSIPPQNLGFRRPRHPPPSSPSSPHSPSTAEPLSPEDAARREIESGTHQLETLLTASIDRNFDKLELYAMQNILTVQPRDLRPHVRLAHYQGLDFDGGQHEEGSGDGTTTATAAAAATVEGVTALRRKVHASQRLNLALQREKARNDALLSSLREVLGVTKEGVKQEEEGQPKRDTGTSEAQRQQSTFGFLHDRPALSSIGSDTPITTTTEFTISQLTSLRALSTTLRRLLPELAEPAPPSSTTTTASTEGGRKGGGRKSWRRERAEYVEQSSRKYLENSTGLELGPQGEVRDGEYQGEGKNLGRGEVEGLEKVVTILGERGT
ncbi:Kinetochore-associated protein-like protein [Hapsidospora chrysogenum ATCC 11550]|uniref:Kinetochore-associated protein-like protein n=1 Tax=Hapsidospora chrysogenum (strain ATCC 11550 / CBS 779.69 / DSM 880 / IAM 14645 / JCM 23072 / IMI 49137) TaxID=857340 RepID=A0A086SZ94_HAPC1|nr:Kinetochore-associated protein-like protein [Hapsidospora chrysogenum ATCC 11550]